MTNSHTYFYSKQNRVIKPITDHKINALAKKKLDELYKIRNKIDIPRKYINNWDKVSLYHPAGDICKANAILIDPNEGAYCLDNKLNHLTGKEWIKFSCSWFIFNALHEDLKEEKNLGIGTEDHPATYSPTMIESFVNFFTKEGQKVLDPFSGIGSTLEACKRNKRIGYGIELNKKYFNISVKRTPVFKNNIFNSDSRKIKDLKLPPMDFSISSPPYWNILNRSTRDFKSNRTKSNLDFNYSDNQTDLGNIDNYDIFLNELANIYIDMYEIMKQGSYSVIIVKNIKKNNKMYPLAWDIARILSNKYTLKDEKIWIQDKIGLAPYGYPFSWASNILHHYCIILKKE